MQDKQIQDSDITVSTGYQRASYGRLHFLRRSWPVTGGWVAQQNDKNPFFQVHFGGWRKVMRVAIQGRHDSDQWVALFSLSYGYDSEFFQVYTEDGAKKVSKGMTTKR